jgi:hypothetical protein
MLIVHANDIIVENTLSHDKNVLNLGYENFPKKERKTFEKAQHNTCSRLLTFLLY